MLQLIHLPAARTSSLCGSRRRATLEGDGPCCFRGRYAAAAVMKSSGMARWRVRATEVEGLQTNTVKNDTQITERPDELLYLHDCEEIPEVPKADLLPLIYQVRAMLRSMNDGEISISAYDTAWVAMVPRLDGGDRPQFPTTVQWIINNQLPDNSWGDAALFSSYDRIMNTLACVVALTKWSLQPDKCQRGLSFLEENMWRLTEEDPDPMPIGFEIAFPSLIEEARSLGIDFPYDHHALPGIYASRDLKLKMIPKDMMHNIPTSILYSLEGMPGLDWQKLLRLQSGDGSFLFSPSATAYALMQTGDKKCLEYINRIVEKFGGGVPNVYPVDLFEHLWAVDRLVRLGISRYFQREIEHCMVYVKRYWTEEGISWARNANVKDLDDTAMAFRLLRLHGHNVSASVFENFEKDGKFSCFAGQSTEAVTGMYNLNRASQISFPGENVLRRARDFSYEFLRERESQGTIRDKWIIAKDLPGEVQYTLDIPWYASLPRLEARTYLDQYGGSDDVWIGKTLYRMPLVNNNTYLELARHDFNNSQVLHQLEWHGLRRWFIESNLESFELAPKDVLRAYFLAVACIFEPNRASERIAWTTVSVLANTISAHIHSGFSGKKKMVQFLHTGIYEENDDLSCLKKNTKDEILVRALQKLIDFLSREAPPTPKGQKYIHDQLRFVWTEWIMQQITIDDDKWCSSSVIQQGPCMVSNKQTCLLIVKIIEICAGRIGEVSSMMNTTHGACFIHLASSICDSLHNKQLLSQDVEKNQRKMNHIDQKIELDMQNLAQYHLRWCDDAKSNNKTNQTFFDVVKTCYYASNCPLQIVDEHVSRVIFQRVI